MFLTLIAFLFTLSVLVFAHELGHFLVAKKAGIKVEEFGFGYPPKIWGKKIGETIYSINLLPIGGFVKLFGEEQDTRYKGAFFAKSKKTRAAVVAAGVVMNLVVATTAFFVINMALGIPTKTDRVKVLTVLEGSPAQEVGMKRDDVIISVKGKEIKSVGEFVSLVNESKGEEIEMTLGRRSGKGLKINIVPRTNPPEGEGPLGVVVSQIEPRFFPWWQMPVLAAGESIKETVAWLMAVVTGMGGMIWQLIKLGQLPKDIAGPVGIFQVTGIVARQGIFSVIQFIGILSVNLVVINVLPIPPLDGGKLLFIGMESIFGRKVTPKVEKWVQNLGMILLLLLLVWITINDISRFLSPVRPF